MNNIVEEKKNESALNLKKLVSVLCSCILIIGLTGQTENSLIWQISGNGLTTPSYLFGTMHTQDQRAFNFRPVVKAVFDSSELYAMELNFDSINLQKTFSMFIMEDNQSLEKLLNESEYQRVEIFFRDSLNIPLFMFNKIYPLFTAQLLETNALNQDQTAVIDIHFYNLAKSAQKLIVGLEKIEDQIRPFKSIPTLMQAKMLLKAIEESEKAIENETLEILEKYIDENLSELHRMTLVEMDNSEESQLMIDLFLNNRNKEMTTKILSLIANHKSFIAVGAAHLPGDNGIIELLRSYGYKISPM